MLVSVQPVPSNEGKYCDGVIGRRLLVFSITGRKGVCEIFIQGESADLMTVCFVT